MTTQLRDTVELRGTGELTGEKADLVETLRRHRGFLLQTLQGLDRGAATRRTTISELDLAGLVKHVAETEERWADFCRRGPAAFGEDGADLDWSDPEALERAMAWHARGFHLTDDETLDGALARYAEVAAATDAMVAEAELDTAHPLPARPWFSPGAVWSVRRVLLHVLAETAQHAGHADILREAIDGAKTMG